MEKEVFIRAEELSYAYEEEEGIPQKAVLRGVSLEIKKGEYVAILGHNGSGKSTFAKLLNMILVPDSGRLWVAGHELTAEDFDENDLLEVRRKIGMVFQNPDNQLVATVVEEDVAFGPENIGIPPKEIRERVDRALETVGMTEYARHSPDRLSGGQKQRVAIAGIIAMMPECMVLDEATAMLDPVGRSEVMDTVDRLHAEKGITVLNITHHMNEAVRADRVIVINDGKIYMDGTPDQVFARAKELEAVGLEVPQCTALIDALREKGLKLEGRSTTPEACAELIKKMLRSNR